MKRLLLAVALLVAMGTAQAEETLAVVVVNGKQVGTEPQLLDPDALAFTPAQWSALGAVLPAELATEERLTAEALGVDVSFDTSQQAVLLTLPARLLPRQVVGRHKERVKSVSPAPKGVLLDYDIAVASVKGQPSVSLGHVARTQFGGGILTTTGQANWTQGHSEYKRGLTTYQRDSLSTGTTVQVGDVFTPSNSLNAPVNLGGVRIGTDRQLVEGNGLSVPLIGGLADTRSTAEVYVNEQRRARGELEAGPYTLDPSIAMPGLNHLDIVQRDAFGREQSSSYQFYAHPDLLAKHRTEWGVTVGKVRSGNTDRYSGTAAHATVQVGVSDRWTLGASAQTGQGPKGGRNLTLHNTVSLGAAGLLQADVSRSQRDDGATGSAFRVGYERQSPTWSITASHQRKSADYWEIADLKDNPFKVRQQTNATFSIHPRNANWSGSLGYTDLRYGDDHRLTQVAAQAMFQTQRTTWVAGVSHDLHTGDTQGYVGVRLQNQRQGNTSFTARAAPNIGPRLDASTSGLATVAHHDVRYQVAASVGERKDLSARAMTTVAGGDLTVEARHMSGVGTMVNGRYRNSVWIGEGGVLNGRGFSSPNSGFVLVEVPKQAGVSIRGNRPTGAKTNKRGYALLTGAGALTPINVRLDEKTVPFEVQLEATSKTAIAPRRGGAKVVFPAQTFTARQYEVRMGDTFAPEGAVVETDSGETFRLGLRGVLVLQQPATRATLKAGQQLCELILPEEGGVVTCDD